MHTTETHAAMQQHLMMIMLAQLVWLACQLVLLSLFCPNLATCVASEIWCSTCLHMRNHSGLLMGCIRQQAVITLWLGCKKLVAGTECMMI